MIQNNIQLTPIQVKQIFENTVVKVADVVPSNIGLHMRLTDGLGLDSLDEVELLINLEQQFDVSIPDTETPRLYNGTVYDVLAVCVKLLVAANRLNKQDAKTVLTSGAFNTRGVNTKPQTVINPEPLLDKYTVAQNRVNAFVQQTKQNVK